MTSVQLLRVYIAALLLSSLVVGLLLLLKWPTSTSSWILLTCCPPGLVSFLHLARAYLAPYLLMRFSSHIKVQSVSLRSIRGLYFRKGNRTWEIDRFGYYYSTSTGDKPKGLFFKIEGLKIEIEPVPIPRPPPPRARHRRGLTLADLSPSPLALYLWFIVSNVYSIIDPAVRPAIRFGVTALLQQVIRFIPRLTETVQLEIDRAVISFNATPRAQLIVEKTVLKGHVSFTQNSQSHPIGDLELPQQGGALTARALAMGAWKSRLAKGFERTLARTWDHTLGQTTGSVAYELVVQEVQGLIPVSGLLPTGVTGSVAFLRSPEPFVSSGSARFSPKAGTIEPGSVHSQVVVGPLYVDVDSLQTLLSHFKAPTENAPVSPLNRSLTNGEKSSIPSDVHVEIATKHSRRAKKPLEFVAVAQFSLASLTVSKRVGRHQYSLTPSDAATNPTHRVWLGKQSPTHSLQAHAFCLAFQDIVLQRPNDMARSFRVLSIGSTSIHAVISNWPSILPVSPSMCWDSNFPSVLLDVKVASVSFTDRLDVLLHLTSELGSSMEVPPGESAPLLPSILSPVPRTVVNISVGRLFTRITCIDTSAVEEPFFVELETEGMVFTSSSTFRTGSATVAPRPPHCPPCDSLPLRMAVPFSCFLHPLFLRLRSSSESTATRRISSDTLFSMDAVEATGVLTALGEVNDDDQSACAALSTRSIFIDLHSRTEAALIELWHPKRLRMISVLLSLLAAHRHSSRPSHTSSKPPVGCSLSFSVARSDLNPDVDKDLTRGVAFSTGLSLRYSVSQSQNRAALLTRASEASGENVAFGKLILWNTTMRSAAADEFSMDDAQISERDSPFLDSKQLLRVKNSKVAPCDLGPIYSALLALRTIQTLRECAAPSRHSPSRPRSPASSTLAVRGALLDQNVVARVNHLNLVSTVLDTHLWVPVFVQKASSGGAEENWLSFTPQLTGPIMVDSDSLRIQLQVAAIVTIKAFMSMPSPEAEAPKLVPDLNFSFRILCLESQLGFNYRIEEAFGAKASAIGAGGLAAADVPAVSTDYQFGSQHSVSIQDARQRLDLAHSLDWIMRHKRHKLQREAQEDLVNRELRGTIPLKRPTDAPDLVKAGKLLRGPPLLRVILSGFRLHLQRPTFPPEQLSMFLHEQGKGLPHETSYSLLIPMHLNISLASLQVTLRDYPLPLLYIPPRASGSPSLLFDSNLVVAEEMGPPQSVEWIPCPIVGLEENHVAHSPILIHVPKTIMPVKTYARPLVSVLADQTTAFAWGVSYSPAIQDIVRVLESFTPETRDSSPHIGFWDKLRLIFHWTIEISFKEEVRLYMKGSHDPYVLENDGAGFALCWRGEPQIKIGFRNEDHEIVQVISDNMSIIIPKFETPLQSGGIHAQGQLVARNDCIKICAKLSSGVRFGVGAAFERTCTGVDCRIFHFLSHYSVQLMKTDSSEDQVNRDSYRGFRSDFIHLSISLVSAIRREPPDSVPRPSSFHLTPKAFTNFWSWWGLFDDGLSLPIRQGSLYPLKALSPKLSRHLATIKYRISVPQLFITHAYIDDTRESWEYGTTSIVGLKAKVNHFQADMHQRDQETIAPGEVADSIQIVRHKPFYAAEVVLQSVDLRAMLATFPEPLKQAVPLSTSLGKGSKNKSSSSSEVPPSWLDGDDFVETDWSPSQNLPELQLFPVLSCPKLTYLKKNPSVAEIHSKFGDEDTHICLLGNEPSVPQVEISLAEQRIATLQRMAEEDLKSMQRVQFQTLEKMALLLHDYNQCPEGVRKSNGESYYMPAEMVSANEWSDFENVYQVHSPNLFMCNSVRDVLMKYYNCSRARRGYEYHMATRAVKFIRDQAEALAPQVYGGAAQAAASALRRMLTRERGSGSLDIKATVTSDPTNVEPLDGCEEGPQIILRSVDIDVESFVILAAVQAKLQVFKIMDASNLEDPISGSIMSRNYLSLDGLQTFCPTDADSYGNGSVPLEVLLDYRCESDVFDRIVPQTNATCRYDRFNRLRLRSNVTSSVRSGPEHSRGGKQAHLHNQTDLVQIHVPRFTVSANDRHFQFISIIITHLILFSDVAHKARLEELETLLFAYDFTDLRSAAHVVSDLQTRLRSAIETHDDVVRQLKAHIFQLVEKLNLIFDAIRLAQSRTDDRPDQKSALLLQASSSEISWMMLDDQRDLLAKLAVRNIDFSWLSKQDSSTVNRLTVGDLQAFDGSPRALWTEIVSKLEEPSNHPLYKRELFLEAEWTILAPVGGITIYEKFQLDFHPIRLQLDAGLGRRILEYDSSRLPRRPRGSLDSNRLAPGLRRLGAPRSFTDLRSAAAESTRESAITASQSSLRVTPPDLTSNEDCRAVRKVVREDRPDKDDAVEMKTRSSQKTFILVKISSIELLLSIMKAESFECRDARIHTHSLEFRNQTWSFEELVDQFIPGDLTWKGWVRMAFHQPLVPVLPVARELFSKTKLIASKSAVQVDPPSSSHKRFILRGKKRATDATIQEKPQRRSSSSGGSSSVLTPSNSLAGTMTG
ncbi:golgi-body localization protein domain-containing protein [Melanogaster broomeanus]|nr:golgi-body localization protein domain-containing protein [Melanogaster broomeanus]